MPESRQLTVPKENHASLTEAPPHPGANIGQMLQAVIEKGVTAENASVMTTLCELYERMEAKGAEREFNAAFVKLQGEIPVIAASSVIQNRGKYERFEDVMRVVFPLLQKNGFSVSFEQGADDKRITVTCNLRHSSGHSTKTPFSVRLGDRADSQVQADCKASTTAKRNALLQALNIVIRQDIFQSDESDPSLEGDGSFITAKQAADLRLRCEEIGADIPRFLTFAEGKTFETIPASRYDLVNNELIRKERTAR